MSGPVRLVDDRGQIFEASPEWVAKQEAAGTLTMRRASDADVKAYKDSGPKKGGAAETLAAGALAANRAATTAALAPAKGVSALGSALLGVDDPLADVTGQSLDEGRIALATEAAGALGLTGVTGEAAARRFRQTAGELAEENPIATGVGEVVGGIGGGLVSGGVAGSGRSAAARLALGSAEAAAQSRAAMQESAQVRDTELTGEQLAQGTLLGAVLGLGVGGAVEGVSGALARRRAARMVDPVDLGGATATAEDLGAVAARALPEGVEPAPGLGELLKLNERYSRLAAGAVSADAGEAALIRDAGVLARGPKAQRLRQIVLDPDAVIDGGTKAARPKFDALLDATNQVTEEVTAAPLKRANVAKNLAGVDPATAKAAAMAEARSVEADLADIVTRMGKRGERAVGQNLNAVRRAIAEIDQGDATDAYLALDQIRRGLYARQKSVRSGAQRSSQADDVQFGLEIADTLRARYLQSAEALFDEAAWGAQGAAQRRANMAWVRYIQAQEAGLGKIATRQGTDGLTGKPIWAADDARYASHFQKLGTDTLAEQNIRDVIATSRELSEAIAGGYDLPAEKLLQLQRLRDAAESLQSTMSEVEEGVRLANQFKSLIGKETSGLAGSLTGAVTGAVLAGPVGALAGAAVTGIARPAHAMRQLATLEAMNRNWSTRATHAVNKAVRKATPKKAERARGAAPMPPRGAARAAPAMAAARFAKPGEDKREAYIRRANELHSAGVPDIVHRRTVDALGDLPVTAPRTTAAAILAAQAATGYLTAQLPAPTKQVNPLAPARVDVPAWSIPREEAERFGQVWDAVADPLSVLDGIEDGTLSSDQVDAIRATWPRLYADLQARALEALRDREDPPEYETAKRLDLLLGLQGQGEPSLRPEFLQRLNDLGAAQGPQASAPSRSSRTPQISQGVGALSDTLEV